MEYTKTERYENYVRDATSAAGMFIEAESLMKSPEWKQALKAMKAAGYKNTAQNRMKLLKMMLKR